MIAAGGMGFSLNPLKAVKKVASGVAHVTTSVAKTTAHATTSVVKATGHGVAVGARATGHGVAVGAKAAGHGVVVAAKTVGSGVMKAGEFAKMIALAPVKLALRPVKSRVNTLTNRRAVKIAWDKRKSKTPTPQERAEARAWTKAELHKKLPHGPLLAMLAGPMPPPSYTDLGSMSTNLGVAPAVIAALVPVFIAILNALLQQFAKSGEAPVSIGPQGQIVLPPGVDPTAVPDAAADSIAMQDPSAMAAEAAADDGSGGMVPGGDDGGGGGGDGGAMTFPGTGGKGPNMMLVGGAVVGVVLLAILLKPKSDSPSKK